MHRIIKLLHSNSLLFNRSSLMKNNKYYSGHEGQKQQAAIIPEVVQKRQFVPDLYGIPITKHIFPHFIKTIYVQPEYIKFYQKNSPNYIVALISKVLEHQQKPANPEIQDVKQKFYSVCTFCKVNYRSTYMQLQGLYKCRIQDIKEYEIKQALGDGISIVNQPIISKIEDNEQGQQDQQQEIRLNKKQNQFLFSKVLKQGLRQPSSKSKKYQVYQLRVRKIEEMPLTVYSKLQMKFKYLIDTYTKMFISNNPVLFKISDLSKTLDSIAYDCSERHSKKELVQKCLESIEPEERIDNVQKLLQFTLQFNSCLSSLQKEAQSSLRNKKFYEYYNEIFKMSKRILAGKKAKQLFLQKVTKNFYGKNPSDSIQEIFQSQKEKYQNIDQNSMEAGVLKDYLEQLSEIPYNVQSEQRFDLKYAEDILQQQHYGIKQIKESILQIIAVGKLKNSLKGKIFCFVGGPGLGKTTFAQSVAKALNRKFYNISLGGVSDSSVLKGHRRTYVGAYSGKIIQALKSCGTNNPVILLDEIDKMGSSYHGDPRSELLQILDPNQNSSFIDNFLDVPVDLSNVLFICSANYEQNISKPLLDRMEKIKLSSYTNFQKKQIFSRHLIKRAVQKTGVNFNQFQLGQNVIDSLVQDYCMGEPGVRYLEKNIVKVLQKIAFKIVVDQESIPIKITKQNLHQYLGNTSTRLKDHNKISKGVAISLGGGEYGGRLTYIEAFKKSHLGPKQYKRGLLFTGSLGDVFKESLNISYSYARNFLKLKLSNNYLYENQVHIHAPDGAQKKEGSTDALTVSSALISLALNKQVKKGVGLTGQLTLHGKVLRTGGIRQKILVAKRQNLKQVVIPYDNYAEVQLLSEQIRQGLKFHFVKEYNEVYNILFKQ